MDVYPEFQEFFKSLNRHGVEYVVIGAYALAYHGVPRATMDLDLLVHASPISAPRIVAALNDFGLGALGLTHDDFQEPRFFFRIGRAPKQIDLLTSLDGVSWDEIWEHRLDADYGGVSINVIGREQFIKSKRALGRLRDLADIERLDEGA